MRRFWSAYQQFLRYCCANCSPRLLQLAALVFLGCTLVLFFLPQRTEWLLLPLLLLLWTLLLLLAQQMFLHQPERKKPDGFFARIHYWLQRGWHQLLLVLFLLLCLLSVAFSLKLAGVILRAILASV